MIRISESANQAALNLFEDWKSGFIDRGFELIVTATLTKTEILPGTGVKNDEKFRIPSIDDLRELDEHRLIDLRQGVTSRGTRKWEVSLKNDLIQMFDSSSFVEYGGKIQDDLPIRLPYIFVSYAREDQPIRRSITEKLRRAYGDNVWADDKLSGGQIWWNEILKRIDQCHIFVFVVSKYSLSSLNCRAEFSEAVRLQKQIIPIIIEKNLELPKLVKKRQYVEIFGRLTVQNVTKLFAALIQRTAEISQTSSTPLWSRKAVLPENTLQLSVPATYDPSEKGSELNTGIFLISGDELVITAAGRIIWGENGEDSSPDGDNNFQQHDRVYKTREGKGSLGSLFGWIDETYFEKSAFKVGSSFEGKVKTDGFLHLAINDAKGEYGNNKGEFQVSILINPQRD